MGGREVSRPYRVWFFAEGERFFYPWGDATALAGEGGVRGVVWLIQAQLEIRHATALTTGAKHWHRQKAVFYVFVSVPQYLSTELLLWHCIY